jgi:hypothetical protein
MNDPAPARLSAAADVADRRLHPREACRYEALCRSGNKAWWPVLFVDLSRSGAGVTLSLPIEVGARVCFTVQTHNGRAIEIRAQVRRVEERDTEWFAGCEFDRLLTESEFADLV